MRHFPLPCLACGTPTCTVPVAPTYWGCRHCGFCTSPVPDCAGVYDAAYAATYRTRAAEPQAAAFAQLRAAHIAAVRPDRTTLVIDCGCGVGATLTALPPPALGYEPMPVMAAAARAQGHAVVTTALALASAVAAHRRTGGRVLLAAFDVLEHLERPDAFLAWLAPDVVVTALPVLPPDAHLGSPARWAALVSAWKHTKPGEHLHLAPAAAWQRVLARAGYRGCPAPWEADERALGREDIVTMVAVAQRRPTAPTLREGEDA